MRREIKSEQAPAAIGSYSQAIEHNGVVYISGQIPLCPIEGQIVDGQIEAQARRVFDNLRAIAQAAGTDLDNVLKLNVSLTNLQDFAAVNEIMADYFALPFPARACVQVAALPKAALIEVDAILAK